MTKTYRTAIVGTGAIADAHARAVHAVLVEKPPVVSLSELDIPATAESHSLGHVAAVFQHRFGSSATRLRTRRGSTHDHVS